MNTLSLKYFLVSSALFSTACIVQARANKVEQAVEIVISDIEHEVEDFMSNKKIKLFVYNGCPYCKKVIKYLESINKLDKVTIVDAGKSDNLKELKKLSGDSQCPYLSDEPKDVNMAESADIIEYFKTRF
jgi:glutaredoxin 3